MGGCSITSAFMESWSLKKIFRARHRLRLKGTYWRNASRSSTALPWLSPCNAVAFGWETYSVSMERFFAIVNPAAGGGRSARLAGPALARLREAGLHIDVIASTAAGHA